MYVRERLCYIWFCYYLLWCYKVYCLFCGLCGFFLIYYRYICFCVFRFAFLRNKKICWSRLWCRGRNLWLWMRQLVGSISSRLNISLFNIFISFSEIFNILSFGNKANRCWIIHKTSRIKRKVGDGSVLSSVLTRGSQVSSACVGYKWSWKKNMNIPLVYTVV